MQQQSIVEQASDPIKFKFHFNNGQNQYLLGNYLKSISAYTEALKINPNSMVCYLGRAACYQKLDKISEAKNDRYMARALQAKPTSLGKRSAQINFQSIFTSKKPLHKTNWELGKISKQNKKSKTDNKKTKNEDNYDKNQSGEIGRWEINRSLTDINAWQQVKEAVAEGYLWQAGLSTNNKQNAQIIMVYTRDCNQIDEVIATFNYLKESGICKPNEVIYYKTDNINEPYLYSSETISWAEEQMKQPKLQILEKSEPSASIIGESLTKAIREDLPPAHLIVDLTQENIP